MAETGRIRYQGFRRTCQHWDEYFMAIALLSAKLSRNPYCQVGACIVNNKRQIASIGYNGMLREFDDTCFRFSNVFCNDPRIYVPHAEINALLNTNSDVKDGTMYITLFPCDKCAGTVIASGIKEIIYLSNKNIHKTKYAKSMFDAAGITHRPLNKRIEINFSDIVL